MMKIVPVAIMAATLAGCATPMPRPVFGCTAEEGRMVANRLARQCNQVAISRVACTPQRSCGDLRREIDRGCAAIPPGSKQRPRFCPPGPR